MQGCVFLHMLNLFNVLLWNILKWYIQWKLSCSSDALINWLLRIISNIIHTEQFKPCPQNNQHFLVARTCSLLYMYQKGNNINKKKICINALTLEYISEGQVGKSKKNLQYKVSKTTWTYDKMTAIPRRPTKFARRILRINGRESSIV